MNSEIKSQILSIANATEIDDTIVNFVQSREIACLMMDKPCFGILNFVGNGKPLVQVIDFIERKKEQHRVLNEAIDNSNPSPLTSLAFHIAETSAKNATTEEERQRAEREKNAANALSKGDIGNAFASLCYWRDR